MAALAMVGACGPPGAEIEIGHSRAAQPSDPAQAQGVIAVRLDVPSRPLTAAEFQEQVKIVVTNVDDDPLRLVAPGDGSDVGWRTPIVGWSVLSGDSTEPRPTVPALGEVFRCGNVNPIRAEELIVLVPGESVEFDSWLSPPQLGAGTFRVAVHYRNDPTLSVQGEPLGVGVPSSRLRKTTPCSGWSSETLVSILE